MKRSEIEEWADNQPHWTLMTPRPKKCFFCGKQCARLALRDGDGRMRRMSCGKRALKAATRGGPKVALEVIQ